MIMYDGLRLMGLAYKRLKKLPLFDNGSPSRGSSS
jgi:hypothetical protein